MLRILRGKPSAAPTLSFMYSLRTVKNAFRRDPEHGVIQDRPLGRVTIVHGKRAALEMARPWSDGLIASFMYMYQASVAV